MVNINKYLIACSAYKDFYMGKSHEIYEERVLDTSHFIHQQKKNFQRNKLFFFFLTTKMYIILLITWLCTK